MLDNRKIEHNFDQKLNLLGLEIKQLNNWVSVVFDAGSKIDELFSEFSIIGEYEHLFSVVLTQLGVEILNVYEVNEFSNHFISIITNKREKYVITDKGKSINLTKPFHIKQISKHIQMDDKYIFIYENNTSNILEIKCLDGVKRTNKMSLLINNKGKAMFIQTNREDIGLQINIRKNNKVNVSVKLGNGYKKSEIIMCNIDDSFVIQNRHNNISEFIKIIEVV